MSNIFSFDDPTTWIEIDSVLEFRNHFTYLRAYHTCRPLAVSTYQSIGIAIPTRKRLYELTTTLLSEHVSPDDLRRAFNKHWNAYYAKGIYFGLDKNFLIQQCGHYLIYGSEFICGVAGEFRCQDVLKRKGRPTVIVANVPTAWISDDMLQALLEKIANSFDELDSIDFGFRITQPLPSENIVGWEYPIRIPDPLNYQLPYTFKENSNEYQSLVADH